MCDPSCVAKKFQFHVANDEGTRCFPTFSHIKCFLNYMFTAGSVRAIAALQFIYSRTPECTCIKF